MGEKKIRRYFIHIALFLLTLLTTTIAGAEHATAKIFAGWGLIEQEFLLEIKDWSKGLPYALSFLAFLSFHEFGHYFTSVYHKVKCSLPFYIPIYIPIPGAINIGSFGAVIRLKERPVSTQKYFDIGIAGPLAGFVISIGLLTYGFLNLPPLESHVLSIHPDYVETFGGVPSTEQMEMTLIATEDVTYSIGTSVLFEVLKHVLPPDPSQVPPHFELMHYPYLFVGYLTLFFTALNLLPIGQLDGGHVIYGMFGPKISGLVSRFTVVILLFLGGTGFIDLQSFPGPMNISGTLWMIARVSLYFLFIAFVLKRVVPLRSSWELYLFTLGLISLQILLKWIFPNLHVNLIWLFYAFLVVRFVGLDHPPALQENTVNLPRKVLGWVAILIFILCFSPEPLQLIGYQV